MVIQVKPGLTVDKVIVPDEWSSTWFRDFINNFLTFADPRNATTLQGQIIKGTINTPASIGPGQINPSVIPSQATGTQQGILAKGNVMPFVQGDIFTYTATSSSLTFTWPSYTLFRPDNTTSTMTGSSQTVTGLSSSTTYTGFALSSEAFPNTMAFITSSTGQVGSPAMLFPPSATTAQIQAGFAIATNLGNIYQAKISGTTTASGTGGGTSGGGGFGGGCPHPLQVITTSKGEVLAKHLAVGDFIKTTDGWAQVLQIYRPFFSEWVQVECNRTLRLMVSPDHRFIDPDGKQIRASQLLLGQVLAGADKNFEVTGLELLYQKNYAVGLQIESPHLYFITPHGPLSHNVKP